MRLSQLFVVYLRRISGKRQKYCYPELTDFRNSVKKIGHIVNWIVWSLMALYILLMVFIHIPVCQRYIGQKVSDAVAEKLDTKVSIGRVDLGFLNRIILDDVLIHDQQQKEMLRVARLSARIDILPLTEGKISISSAQIFGARAQFYRQDSLAKPNFQFVLDSLASKDTTSHTPLDLHINSLIIRRSSIKYDEHHVAPTPELFNLHHMNVQNISAHIILKTLTDDSLDVNLKRLGLTDHSGLKLDKLSFRLKAGRQGATLRNFRLLMPSTQICIDSIDATYRYKNNHFDASTLTLDGEIRDSYITPSDLRCFYSPLKNFQKELQIETRFTEENQRLTIPQLHIKTESNELNLLASGVIAKEREGLSWMAKVDDLSLTESTIDFLSKIVPEVGSQGKVLQSLQHLQLSGNFSGEPRGALTAKTFINSDLGNLDLDFQMSAAKQFKGEINTEGLNLRQLLSDEHLGTIATRLTVDGQLNTGRIPTINAQGFVSHLDYNDYPYSNIGIDGSYSPKGLSGFIKIGDPNLEAELEGNLMNEGPQNKQYKINLKGYISHLVPQALKLTDQWGNAQLSANIDADLTAKTIQDAQGVLRISNFMMTSDLHDAYHLDNLLLTSGYEDQRRYVTLVSDFAKADLRGEFQYQTLVQSLINYVGSALPTLPGLPPVTKSTQNDFALKLQVFKSDWLQRLLGMEMSFQQPITLSARVNDYNRTVNMEGMIPDITYNGTHYTNGYVRITTPIDTIKCNLAIKRISESGNTLDIQLRADAIDNHLNTSLTWDNGRLDNEMSGKLNMIASLYRNLMEKPEAHIQVQPSHIVLGGTTWNVEPSDIIYSTNNMLVNHFTIHNGQQHIIIDGKATSDRNDSLTVDLNDVEVAYILDLVNFHSVEFSGEASGTAFIKAPFGSFMANADLSVGNFKFEKGHMGTLYAKAVWNKEREQIDIDAVADDGPEAKTLINGYVSPTYNTIDLGITANGTYIDFMHNFTNSFLSSITGHANGAVRLAGSLDEINLTGKLIVEGEATVTPLNTTYTLRQDTVILIPDEIELHQMAVYDQYDNKGILSGGIHHQHLTNLSYDLYVTADNLLAYDFKDFGESTFYGTVFASGDVAIHGRSGEVTIDCNVTPQKNSVFVYNASSPDEISNQEFIQWGSAHSSSDRSNSQLSTLRSALPLGSAKNSQLGSSTWLRQEIPTDDIPTDIYINFLINCTPDATLRLLMDANTNDYITLNGDGTIRATFYNKGPFNMFGTYTVDHGTYGVTIQNIIKKNFTFNRGGTIVFGGDPYNAALNLQALYTVNGVSLSDLNIGNSFASNTIRVNCLMNISGQPIAPQVDFDLEMPTVNADEQQMIRSIINGQQEMNQQVLYLLGIGRFYNQGQNNANTDQADQTTLAMQSFLSGTLSTQINSLLSTVIKNDNWNFGANISTGNEGWHNAEYEGIISGRMLNNRLLLNGQFGYRDNATQANPSFIGDFDLQYLLYPNGNLALKVYNQTNDRYFTKSSLNTQGIGLIMKKDFNGLRDFFSSMKKKKNTKKNQK